ncbi:MAG: GGDEF domain-containing protein [Alphaproteobacteria bacterium]|jgi:diguanylate cyclase (GGDEF)-like protein|nr:GGDEF domain-containing protein [Alphaproteobacteria bacterium]
MTDSAYFGLAEAGTLSEVTTSEAKASLSHFVNRFARAGLDPWDLVNQAMSVAAEAQRTIAQQQSRIARLEDLLVKDELTGLLNRRGLEDAFTKALDLANRHGEGGVLAYIDLDDFKEINDTFGHGAGDLVLKRVSRILSESVRASDVVARHGGDEFAVLMVRADHHEAMGRAQAFDDVLNQATVSVDKKMIQIRASLGTAIFSPGDHQAEILRRADEEMYRNKRSRASGLGLLN